MACPPAKLEATRRNGSKSNGPKPPEGKEISRANSLKHGLTGAGIVLPIEDAEAIDRRFATLVDEMKPKNEVARQLVSRIALLMTRLERSALHEAKAITHKMRKAEGEYTDARLAEVEKHYSWIAAEPATNARRLRNFPEGVNRLLSVLHDLRADLDHPEGHRWDWQRCEQLHHMLGLRPCDVPFSRARVLSDAMEGNFRHLNQEEGGDLDIMPRRQWAETALLALIDTEIAKLEALRDSFDLEAIDRDRDEAAHRALFDPSPEAALARKYEAATERGLYKALKEFREIQGEEPQTHTEPEVATGEVEEMGSSFPDPSGRPISSTCLDPINANRAVETSSRRDPRGPGGRKSRRNRRS